MNLIHDAWIPVRRRNGNIAVIAPWQITEGTGDDELIELAAPRPDFNGALMQFLIGLVQTTCAPETPRDWRRRLKEPPNPKELKAAFEPVAHAFNLDGDEPRFMQDSKLDDGASFEIEQLIVGAPGEDRGLNTDHFIKRGHIKCLCRKCSAMALLSMQINGPSGGRGYFPGLRGSGPLTTLIYGDTLWESVWMNTLEKHELGNPTPANQADNKLEFVWMDEKLLRQKKIILQPSDLHPHAIYWPMPRQIKLIFASVSETLCDSCGELDEKMVKSFVTKAIKYDGPWKHPLSPHTIDPEGTPNAKRPRVGGITYRHWLGLIFSTSENGIRSEPALVVESFLNKQSGSGKHDMKLWAFGFDIKPAQAKIRCFYDSKMPLILIEQALKQEYQNFILRLIGAAYAVSGSLMVGLMRGLFFKAIIKKEGNNVRVEWEVPKNWGKTRKEREKYNDETTIESQSIRDTKAFLESIRARFWQETEAEFFVCLQGLRNALTAGTDIVPVMEAWHKVLTNTAEAIFNDLSQVGMFEAADPKRIALAWRDLRKSIYGKKLREQLGLP